MLLACLGRVSRMADSRWEARVKEAVFSILDAELIAGSLPRKQTRWVQAWIQLHQESLMPAVNMPWPNQPLFGWERAPRISSIRLTSVCCRWLAGGLMICAFASDHGFHFGGGVFRGGGKARPEFQAPVSARVFRRRRRRATLIVSECLGGCAKGERVSQFVAGL